MYYTIGQIRPLIEYTEDGGRQLGLIVRFPPLCEVLLKVSLGSVRRPMGAVQ